MINQRYFKYCEILPRTVRHKHDQNERMGEIYYKAIFPEGKTAIKSYLENMVREKWHYTPTELSLLLMVSSFLIPYL